MKAVAKSEKLIKKYQKILALLCDGSAGCDLSDHL